MDRVYHTLLEKVRYVRACLNRPTEEVEEVVWDSQEDQARFGDVDGFISCFAFLCGATKLLDLELRDGKSIDLDDLDTLRNAGTLIRWTAVLLERIAKGRKLKAHHSGEYGYVETNAVVLSNAANTLSESLDTALAERRVRAEPA